MDIKEVNIKDGAVFIADVHYKKGDIDFLGFLEKLNKNPPSQFFLVGDIFHLLLPFEYLINYNKDAINLINSIAKKSDVYYIRGNHDFWINGIFENIEIADAFIDKQKSIFVTHGDLNERDFLYRLYSKLIRNRFLLKALNLITFNFYNNYLFKKILEKKIKCFKIKDFKAKIEKKITYSNYKTIIEGHYHQNVIFKLNNQYINLGAFYCDRSYYIFDNGLKEKKF